jgi:hypothetical protein
MVKSNLPNSFHWKTVLEQCNNSDWHKECSQSGAKPEVSIGTKAQDAPAPIRHTIINGALSPKLKKGFKA